jgi:hypothetical protein
MSAGFGYDFQTLSLSLANEFHTRSRRHMNDEDPSSSFFDQFYTTLDGSDLGFWRPASRMVYRFG